MISLMTKKHLEKHTRLHDACTEKPEAERPFLTLVKIF
jgi:hypothetical protein